MVCRRVQAAHILGTPQHRQRLGDPSNYPTQVIIQPQPSKILSLKTKNTLCKSNSTLQRVQFCCQSSSGCPRCLFHEAPGHMLGILAQPSP